MRTLLFALVCLFPIPLVAQVDLTIHVECGAWGITDHKWQIEITVNDGSDDYTITVYSHPHTDSSHFAVSMAKLLNAKMGRRDFKADETEHASSNDLQGEDVVIPAGVEVKSVVTKKEGQIANDHIRVYEDGGSRHIN